MLNIAKGIAGMTYGGNGEILWIWCIGIIVWMFLMKEMLLGFNNIFHIV